MRCHGVNSFYFFQQEYSARAICHLLIRTSDELAGVGLPLYQEYIRADQDQIVQAFFTKAGFPYIIGVIDGTHVEILKPTCKLLN